MMRSCQWVRQKNRHNNYNIGVRCCVNEVDDIGFTDEESCLIAADYFEAKSHCKELGMVLCSQQQIINQAGWGSGCGFDTYHVWTRDTCEELGLIANPTKSPTPSPETTTTDTTTTL